MHPFLILPLALVNPISITLPRRITCHRYVADITDILNLRRLLCEVHEEYSTNIALALHGYWVYDFSLPLLILHAFTFKTMDNLRHWLGICPRRQITVLDTHDGMGIDDIAGLAEVRCIYSP